jgi:hypothetical protein
MLMMLLIPGWLYLPCWGNAAQQLPAASEVTRRMIERSQAVAGAVAAPQYIYEKRSLLEHLDATGRPMNSEEKVYQVTLAAGLPFNRLVRIKGRELSGEELRREDDREERFRRRFVSADAKKLAAQKEGLVTPELLDRYQFAVVQRVVLSNRPTLVLTFKPKEGDLPDNSVQDKVLNRMAGRVWVDEADADTARLEASLVAPLALGWFAVLGSLSRCDVSLERQRMPDGVWINNKQVLLIQFRKLAATVRFRTKEACSGFQKVEAKQ